MPDVVQTASKVDIASHVRDGYIMMFIYLPLTFGDKFTPYVGPIIPCILKVLVTKSYLLLRVKHFKITMNNNIKMFLFLYSYFQLHSQKLSLLSCSRTCFTAASCSLSSTRRWLMRTSTCETRRCEPARESSACTLRPPSHCCFPSWNKDCLMTCGESGQINAR